MYEACAVDWGPHSKLCSPDELRVSRLSNLWTLNAELHVCCSAITAAARAKQRAQRLRPQRAQHPSPLPSRRMPQTASCRSCATARADRRGPCTCQRRHRVPLLSPNVAASAAAASRAGTTAKLSAAVTPHAADGVAAAAVPLGRLAGADKAPTIATVVLPAAGPLTPLAAERPRAQPQACA